MLLLKPFGFRIAPDTLPSEPAAASGRSWLMSGFRLRARFDVSIPSSRFGRRGITPAFGYGAPHPSAGGTSTLLTHALPSAHYEPLRHPAAPGLSLAGVRLVIADHALGLPVLRALSLCTCCRQYPGAAAERIALLTSPSRISLPRKKSGSACALMFSRCYGAAARRLRPSSLMPNRWSPQCKN